MRQRRGLILVPLVIDGFAVSMAGVARIAISRTRTEIERGTAQLGAPFPHTDELAAARAQLAAIEAEMQAQAAPPPDEQTTPDGNAAPAEHGQLFLLSEGQSIPGGSARHRGP